MPWAEGSVRRILSAVPRATPNHAAKFRPTDSGTRRFGTFEVDFHAGELHKAGVRISIQDQPLQVLSILLDRPGEVITREEFRDLLWPEHTFVDFDHSLNSAIRKLRHALSDHPDRPHLIETLPRHGYRYIGPAQAEPLHSLAEQVLEQDGPNVTGDSAGDFAAIERLQSSRPMVNGHFVERRKHRRYGRTRAVVMAAGTLLLAVGFLASGYWSRRRTVRPSVRPTVMLAVIPLNNLGHDPSEDFMAEGMTEELITRLGEAEPSGLGVIAHTSVEQYKHTTKPVSVIGKELGVDYVLEGSARVEGNRVRIAVQLIRVSDQIHLWAGSYDSTLDDMLGLQADVAANVVQAIHGKLQLPPAMARPAPG